MTAQVHLERADVESARTVLNELTRINPGEPEVQAAIRMLESGGVGRIDLDHTVRAEWHSVSKNPAADRDHRTPARFTRDATRLITAAGSQRTDLWDTRSGECVHTYSEEDCPAQYAEPYVGYGRYSHEREEYYFLRQAWCADGSQSLAVGGSHKGRHYKVRHVDHARKTDRLIAELDFLVLALAFTPDGGSAVIASNDQRIPVWNLHTGECERASPRRTEGERR